MSIFIGWRFEDQVNQQIYDWMLRCIDLQRPIHPSRLCIPLVFHGGDKMDGFKPMGTDIQFRLQNNPLKFDRCDVIRLGDRNSVVLKFEDPKVEMRADELCTKGFPHRRRKFIARLPISIHSNCMSGAWAKSFPLRNQAVKVVEEFAIPFDSGIGAYAHTEMSDKELWLRQKMTS